MKYRLDYLDSIRGVAALTVLISHLLEVLLLQYPIELKAIEHIFSVVDIGRLGVIVFFITSGFVIPWSLSKPVPHTLKNFAVKRFFRLYPAYWFAIILSLVTFFIFGQVKFVQIESASQVLLNFSMVQKFLGTESIIGAFWTLHLELVFYVLCALLFYVNKLSNKHYFGLVIFFSCVACLFAFIRFNYSLKLPIVFPLGLASMFYGALVRSWLLDKNKALLKPIIFLTVIFFSLLIVTQKMYFLEGWVKWFNTYVLSFLFFYFFIIMCKLNDKRFTYLGKISYSLYLLHQVVIGVIYFYSANNAYSLLNVLNFSIATIVFSILVAATSYHFIEKPSLVLGRKFQFKDE